MQNVLKQESGILFNNSFLNDIFKKNDLSCIHKLRENLINQFPDLCEKINKKSKYFGFSLGNQSDSFYIYLQKQKMIMDIRLSYSIKNDLLQEGFKIKERKNFQEKSGWITGIELSYDCHQIKRTSELVINALSLNL